MFHAVIINHLLSIIAISYVTDWLNIMTFKSVSAVLDNLMTFHLTGPDVF